MKTGEGLRRAVGFMVFTAVSIMGPVQSFSNKDVILKVPRDGDVFYVGQPIEISGKGVGQPSPSAQATIRLLLSQGRVNASINPTKKHWSLSIVSPLPSATAILQVNYSDPEQGEFAAFERTISILP